MPCRRPRRTSRLPSLCRCVGASLLALAVLAGGRPVQAQQVDESVRRAVSTLPDSATVRVIAPGVFVEPGLFLGVVGDSLRLSDADARIAVAFDELEELSVQRSQWLKVGASTAGIAAIFGAAIGYFIGTGDCDFQLKCGRYQVNGAFRYGSAFALVGGVVGTVVGSQRTSWRPIFP